MQHNASFPTHGEGIETSESHHLFSLPNETLLSILSHLPPSSIYTFSKVSRRARELALCDDLWWLVWTKRTGGGTPTIVSDVLGFRRLCMMRERIRRGGIKKMVLSGKRGSRLLGVVGVDAWIKEEDGGLRVIGKWRRNVGFEAQDLLVVAKGKVGLLEVQERTACIRVLDMEKGEFLESIDLPLGGERLSLDWTCQEGVTPRVVFGTGINSQCVVYATEVGGGEVRVHILSLRTGDHRVLPRDVNCFSRLVRTICTYSGLVVIRGFLLQLPDRKDGKRYAVQDIISEGRTLTVLKVLDDEKLIDALLTPSLEKAIFRVVNVACLLVVAFLARIEQSESTSTPPFEGGCTPGKEPDDEAKFEEIWMLDKVRNGVAGAGARDRFEVVWGGRGVLYGPAGPGFQGHMKLVTFGDMNTFSTLFYKRLGGDAFDLVAVTIHEDILIAATRVPGLFSVFHLDKGRVLDTVSVGSKILDVWVSGDIIGISTDVAPYLRCWKIC